MDSRIIYEGELCTDRDEQRLYIVGGVAKNVIDLGRELGHILKNKQVIITVDYNLEEE